MEEELAVFTLVVPLMVTLAEVVEEVVVVVYLV